MKKSKRTCSECNYEILGFHTEPRPGRKSYHDIYRDILYNYGREMNTQEIYEQMGKKYYKTTKAHNSIISVDALAQKLAGDPYVTQVRKQRPPKEPTATWIHTTLLEDLATD